MKPAPPVTRFRVENGPRRLDEVLRETLSSAGAEALSKAVVRKLIVCGAVRVGGRIARKPAALASPGALVEARVDLARLSASRRHEQRLGNLGPQVLYEDDALLAVDKPAGLAFHAGADPRRPDFVTRVSAWLEARDGRAALGVHQRLDRDTSGVVVFGKTLHADRSLGEQFAKRTIEKVYWALAFCRGAARETWEEGTPVEGRPAVTRFTVLERLGAVRLVEARPVTGRKHQVRVHLARAGCAVVGDRRYGGGGPVAPRTMLHARRLTLLHPVTGERLVIESPLPADFQAAREAALRQARRVADRRGYADVAARTSGSKLHRPGRPAASAARARRRR